MNGCIIYKAKYVLSNRHELKVIGNSALINEIKLKFCISPSQKPIYKAAEYRNTYPQNFQIRFKLKILPLLVIKKYPEIRTKISTPKFPSISIKFHHNLGTVNAFISKEISPCVVK